MSRINCAEQKQSKIKMQIATEGKNMKIPTEIVLQSTVKVFHSFVKIFTSFAENLTEYAMENS